MSAAKCLVGWRLFLAGRPFLNKGIFRLVVPEVFRPTAAKREIFFVLPGARGSLPFGRPVWSWSEAAFDIPARYVVAGWSCASLRRERSLILALAAALQ